MRSRSKRSWTVVAAVALAVSLGACDALGPDEVEGDYTLVRMDAETLGGVPPVVVFTGTLDGQEFLLRVLAGSLEISGGRYTLELTAECEIDGEVDDVCSGTNSSSGRYDRDGQTITFMPGNATADADLGEWDPRNERITYIDSHPDYGTLTAIFQRD